MLNPILAFSATRRMRSFRTLLIAAAWLIAMLMVVLLVMGSLFGSQVSIRSLRSGVNGYLALMIVQFALIVLIAPAMTSGSIAGERERQTLELLLVTNTRSFRIVAGKAMESFAMLALLIVCGFPVMCLTMLAGAVTLPQILAGELFLMVVAFAAVCVGVLASSLTRSSVAGGVISYLMIFTIAVVTTLPMILEIGFTKEVTDIVYNQSALASLPRAEALEMIVPLLFLNPGYALAALLHGQTGILNSLMQYHDSGRLLCSFKLMDRAGGETVALISCGAVALLGVLLLVLAAFVLRRTAMKSGSGK
jgi:ABC-type transport system involved in multi-copper enzyme maturation permease subunit